MTTTSQDWLSQIKERVVCILFLVLFATSLMAQERVGTVEGSVLDASGASIAGATVELKGGTFIKEAVTNSTGGYLIGAVPPGVYVNLAGDQRTQ